MVPMRHNITMSSLSSALILLLVFAHSYASDCVIHTLGQVKILGSGAPVIIEAELNRKKVAFVINTTLPNSIIYRVHGEDSDVHLERPTDSIFGLGGSSEQQKIWVWELRIGTAKLNKAQFNEGPERNASIESVPIVGEIGNDILSLYDVDINIPQKRLSFYQTEGCSSVPPMWKGKIWKIPTSYRTPPLGGRIVASVEENIIQSHYSGNQIKVDFKIDNIKSTGIIDTSSAHTSVSRGEKFRNYKTFRLYKENDNNIISGGRDLFVANLYIGPLELQNANIYLDRHYDDENVIGADLLKYMEVWVPAEGGEIYVTNIMEP